MRTFFLCLMFCSVPTALFAQAEYVVVPRRAVLYASATPGSPSFSSKKDGYTTFLFVEKRGSRYRVRTISDAPLTSCYGTYSVGVGFELDFWVQSKDVMWVVTQRHQRKFLDGTEVDLKPGVVLFPGESSTDWYADLGLFVPISYEFAAKKFVATKRELSPLYPSPYTASVVQLNGRRAKDLSGFEAVPFIDSEQRSMARLSNICFDAVLSVTEPVAMAVEGMYGMGSGAYPKISVPPGASVFWTSGKLAGRVRETYRLDGIEPSQKVQDLICYRFSAPNPEDTPRLEFCFKNDEIWRRK